MNLRDPKNQIFVIVIILIVAVVYFWYTKIYVSYNERMAMLVQEQTILAEKLNSVKQKAATLDQLEKEYEDLLMRYKRVEQLLPEKKEEEAILSQVHNAAQLTASVVKKITPMGTQILAYYETNNYSMEVESSYHGMATFFAKVANFPFIVNIYSLQLKSSKEGTGAALLDPNMDIGEHETVTATFKFSTYNVKQGVSG